MAATAAARRLASASVAAPARPPARRAPARRRSRPRTRAGRPPGPRGQLIPLAVGRTAVAVRGLPELRLVHRMTRGQLWIGVLGTLLVGIVALNVVSLSLSTSSGRVVQQIVGLEQQNSVLRTKLATKLSDERIQEAAARLGLVVPDPGQIRYLTAGERYAAIAARRLGAGDFTVSSALAPVPATTATTIPTAPAPTTTTTPGASTTQTPAPTDQAAAAPPPAAPLPAPTAPTAPTGGGVPAQ